MGVAVDEVLPRYLPPRRRKTKASAPVCFVVSVVFRRNEHPINATMIYSRVLCRVRYFPAK